MEQKLICENCGGEFIRKQGTRTRCVTCHARHRDEKNLEWYRKKTGAKPRKEPTSMQQWNNLWNNHLGVKW